MYNALHHTFDVYHDIHTSTHDNLPIYIPSQAPTFPVFTHHSVHHHYKNTVTTNHYIIIAQKTIPTEKNRRKKKEEDVMNLELELDLDSK